MLKNSFALSFSLLSALVLATPAFSLEVGDTAPCVSVKDVQTNGTELVHCVQTPERDDQYVVLDFFSITCSVCIENLPTVAQLAHEISPVATTRLVAVDRNESQVRAFLKSQGGHIVTPVALDTTRAATKAYGIQATPTTFVIDPSHKIIFKHEGGLSAAELQTIKNLVK